MNSSLRRIASHNPVVVVAAAAAMKMKVKEPVVAAVLCRTTPSNSANKHKRQPAGDASIFPAEALTILHYTRIIHQVIFPQRREKKWVGRGCLCFVCCLLFVWLLLLLCDVSEGQTVRNGGKMKLWRETQRYGEKPTRNSQSEALRLEIGHGSKIGAVSDSVNCLGRP